MNEWIINEWMVLRVTTLINEWKISRKTQLINELMIPWMNESIPGLPCRLVAGRSETQVPLTLGVGDFVRGEDLEIIFKNINQNFVFIFVSNDHEKDFQF